MIASKCVRKERVIRLTINILYFKRYTASSYRSTRYIKILNINCFKNRPVEILQYIFNFILFEFEDNNSI